MDAKFERAKRRYTSGIGWAALTFLVCFIFWFVFFRPLPGGRLTAVIVANPIVVWSLDSERHTAVIVTILPDTTVEATRGYGRYPLDSLWKFGQMNREDRGLLAETLQDSLGVPIHWYLGGLFMSEQRVDDPTKIISRAISLSSASRFFRGEFRTNIDPLTYMRFLKEFYFGRKSTTTIDLTDPGALDEEQLPDGGRIYTVNARRLDTLLGHLFEEGKIREENLTISIFNTTKTPTLGERVSRFVAHMGGNVVSVGNSKEIVSSMCHIRADRENLKRYTARRIQQELGCLVLTASPGGERTDLSIFIGQEYANRYIPRKTQN